MQTSLRLGSTGLIEDYRNLFLGRRIGLLTHPAAVDSMCEHTLSHIRKAGGTISALFGPEHGVLGAAQDMEEVPATDLNSSSAIRHYSLYGSTYESLSPKHSWLEDIDVMIIDLQDVGSRYYTYIWTMLLMMRVCAERGVEVIVLDRPNPLGGTHIEGPLIEEGYESFVGLLSLPVRHGMTIGELAQYFKAEENLDLSLDVIPMQGYRRQMYFPDTLLPWVSPSPNMPSFNTALVYPGGCLIEGTNLSEGRGTTLPFECVGAPFIDAERIVKRLNDEKLSGITFRPVYFKPMFHKHCGKICGGVQLHIRDKENFLPFKVGVAFLLAICQLWPDEFGWRKEAYEFVADRYAIDLLAGGSWLREAIEENACLGDCSVWQNDELLFFNKRSDYLLYRE